MKPETGVNVENLAE